MRRFYIRAITVLFTGILLALPGAAKADKAREFAVSWDLCASATHAVEAEARLPYKLLSAISIAESGRRDDLNKANVAWPWTVTSGSKEWYFDTKADAVSHVRAMIASGKRNIDVGCMQVNLFYHGKAFKSLEQAFDPLSNVSYAATFLRQLRASAPDWLTAAGNYHSATPTYHKRYKKKITEIWNAERRVATRDASSNTMQIYYGLNQSATQTGAYEVKPVDLDRTAKLNNALRARKLAEAENLLSAGNMQMDAPAGGLTGEGWKTAYAQGVPVGDDYSLTAQIQRLRKASQAQKRLELMIANEGNISASKRASDLELWRRMYTKTTGEAAP